MKKLLMGRKFIVGMSALAGAFVLALVNKLTAEYATVASIVVGSFSAADAYITGKTFTPDSTGSTTETK
jgi:hypothetical protein